MTNVDIKEWLTYWDNAKMVDLDAITSFDRVFQARKYCQCMRVGVFTDISDLQIWNALQLRRNNGKTLKAPHIAGAKTVAMEILSKRKA